MIFLTLTLGLLAGYVAFSLAAVFRNRRAGKEVLREKYGKTGLSKEFSMELRTKLISLMEHDKPYLDANMRLDTIAHLLDVSRHHASQIINEHFSLHFFDFINMYRVREAAQLLSTARKRDSIADIAYQCGFNNRISFYKAFKKIRGVSPSEFRENYLTKDQ
ncbi:helix-turn-helix domain-containing protein [Flavobacteriaceae bacterium 3-367]